ncbi:tryptophan synthase subunit alpha [Enterobacteriaceae endosymbiont of Donacia tomentosa]|uniref:tryptophan synthase subunit alpha n=1 Tax=Enterobacteriaceae endosymbiont of Donacia tomentosa TaxID=2675787 RepID=UPI001449DD1B|nr:tryptophan synthase subunit alpha [Enterobacteriaceae endosymbiont of Donacia tomentosa]QJC31548.1 tryptophan synthase subunit alpha [Enterobacteriaceae endosymbiont of Donacia tomentosa]
MNKYYDNMFQKLNNNKAAAFIPFLTVGYPSIKIFIKIIELYIKSGADALELGIPFSDPFADGNIIQKANLQTLKIGINIIKCFQIIKNIRNKYKKIPIGILTYANIIISYGIKNFYIECYRAGINSVLIIDLPIEEFNPFYRLTQKNKISPILICPPNVDKNFYKKISLFQCAYIYVMSRSGITGYDQNLNTTININYLFNNLKKHNLIPIQGFGICNTKQIKKSIKGGSCGVIVGSFLIDIIQKYQDNIEVLFYKLKKILIKFKKATLLTG